MAGFDAGDEVDPLDYDFDSLARRYPGKYPALEGVKGTSPEPSDEMIDVFQKDMTRAMRLVLPPDVDPTDRAAVTRATTDLPDGKFAESEAAIAAAVAKLVSNEPTQGQISALPFRHKRRYIQWLQRQLMSPEAETAATSPSPVGPSGG